MTNILVSDFITGFLIFLRIVAVVFTAPVLNSRNIPTTAKLIFSIVITYIVFFMVPQFSYNYEEGLIPLALIGIKELITGMIIGFTFNFVFYGMSYAGMLIGFDIGLGAAMGFDPTSESNSNLIGQIFSVIALLIFVLIDGHHYIIHSMGFSFKTIPIGYYSINQPVTDMLIKYSATIFILAVKMASPIMVSFFLLHIAAGIIARVSPQMNVFFVLQPLQMGLGFLVLIGLVPIYVFAIKNILQEYETKLFELIKAMGI